MAEIHIVTRGTPLKTCSNKKPMSRTTPARDCNSGIDPAIGLAPGTRGPGAISLEQALEVVDLTV
jgi:hypothetical protein